MEVDGGGSFPDLIEAGEGNNPVQTENGMKGTLNCCPQLQQKSELRRAQEATAIIYLPFNTLEEAPSQPLHQALTIPGHLGGYIWICAHSSHSVTFSHFHLTSPPEVFF